LNAAVPVVLAGFRNDLERPIVSIGLDVHADDRNNAAAMM
jgi:hypothetical protein